MSYRKGFFEKRLNNKRVIISILAMILGVCVSGIVLGQEVNNTLDTLRKGALNFYLDCRSCDENYTKQEIPYVNYVRDTKLAEVYLLVTSQNAGSGGNQFTFSFQ